MSNTEDRPRYQAWITVGFEDVSAEARYSQREAKADADRMHAEHDGTCRAVVLDMQHYSVGSLASCVYLLPIQEAA